MDYPHRHHSRREEEEDEFNHARPHAPPFHGGDQPSPPFFNQPPPPFHAGNNPHAPPFHGGVNEPSPPFYGGLNDPPPPFTHGGGPHAPPSYGGSSHAPPSYGGGPHAPPSYGGSSHAPPSYGGSSHAPPQAYHTSHTGPESYRPHAADEYAPPPPVVERPGHHPHMPHFPSHHKEEENRVPNKPTVRVYTKAEPNYSLTVRDGGHVVLARSDPADPFQHWIKDERLSTKVKDEEGYPSFSLVNKATGQAMKHSIGATHPVQLIPYNPNTLDESILWCDKDLGDGYRVIRMVNNIKLNLDAFNGDKNHGGVHDGTKIVLWEWKKGDNQRWKIVPY